MLAILPELEAATFALPCGSGLSHLVGLAFASLDLDGLCGLVGVVGIPILSGFCAPAKELFNIFAGCAGVYFNMSSARTRIGLSRCVANTTQREATE